MREISPAYNLTADEFLRVSPREVVRVVEKIRQEKEQGGRSLPSDSLIDKSNFLNQDVREFLVNEVAMLVDENLTGRSDMCSQFAMLLSLALNYLGVHSRPVAGVCIFFKEGKEIYRWDHAWVRVDNEVIDGNLDILYENPLVPNEISVKPYWGSISNIPSDRRLRETNGVSLPEDDDVSNVWWPDLKDRLAHLI